MPEPVTGTQNHSLPKLLVDAPSDRCARIQTVAVFCGVFLIEMVFAFYTRDAWEDFYITFRASRNLAVGNGLVFNPGERVHSFTSPLHTLLLAGLSYLTGNVSEQPVLWLSRILLSGVLAWALVLLLRVCRRAKFTLLTSLFLVLFLMFDAKTVDFTINGMEVPLMVFFLVLALSVHARPCHSQSWRLLGLAWAGLQWTRPDGFIYGGLLAAGFFLFPAVADRQTRKDILVLYFKAGLLSLILYLPWVLGTWYYYGSPIPHPVLARRGSVRDLLSMSPTRYFELVVTYTLDAIFAPAGSSVMPGWPPAINTVYSRGLAVVAATYWLMPFGRPMGHAASFAFMGACAYLALIVQGPMPWYMPSTMLFGLVALANVLDSIASFCGRQFRQRTRKSISFYRVVLVVIGLVIVIQPILTVCVANQLQINQEILENGNRKQIGLWLRDHASPHDTVFVECLGYIGYFSQLKMYDYPGLSSPEVVAVRRHGGDNYASIIEELKPTWLVLRPVEIQRITSRKPTLLQEHYSIAETFDVGSALDPYLKMPGVATFDCDRTFIVYHRIQD